MEVELEDMYKRLSLMEEEKEEAKVEAPLVEEVLVKGNYYLIIRLLSNKNFNKEVLKQIMKKIWRLRKIGYFRDLVSILLLAKFEDKKDKERVMREGPWTFDKQLLVVWDFDGTKQVGQIRFIETTFWIRIYDLPLMTRNEYTGKLIGGSFGRFEQVDQVNGEMAWSEIMWIRVTINITKSLLRDKMLNINLRNQFGYAMLSNAY